MQSTQRVMYFLANKKIGQERERKLKRCERVEEVGRK